MVAANPEESSDIPILELAQYKFLLGHPDKKNEQKEIFTEKILPLVKEHSMGPFYTDLCKEVNLQVDKQLEEKMTAENDTKIAAFEAEIKDAVENLDAWLRKSEFYCMIGNKQAALSSFRQTFEKTVGIGNRIDLVFQLIRIGLFYMDHPLVTTNLAKIKDLMEQGGDWDRKNRLKAYEALYLLSIRDFKGAANLFLDAVPTFGSYELMTYEQLIFYTVVSSMLALDRPELREKVLKGAEIQEQLESGGKDGSLVNLKSFVHSFYDCEYGSFFSILAQLESQLYLAPHYAYYVRAMRVKAYQQFLTPYKTVSLKTMAENFGVSTKFLDHELHQLVATSALHCRVDAVHGVVETNQPDVNNSMYANLIRDGDVMLNRIQKLARVIND